MLTRTYCSVPACAGASVDSDAARLRVGEDSIQRTLMVTQSILISVGIMVDGAHITSLYHVRCMQLGLRQQQQPPNYRHMFSQSHSKRSDQYPRIISFVSSIPPKVLLIAR